MNVHCRVKEDHNPYKTFLFWELLILPCLEILEDDF